MSREKQNRLADIKERLNRLAGNTVPTEQLNKLNSGNACILWSVESAEKITALDLYYLNAIADFSNMGVHCIIWIEDYFYALRSVPATGDTTLEAIELARQALYKNYVSKIQRSLDMFKADFKNIEILTEHSFLCSVKNDPNSILYPLCRHILNTLELLAKQYGAATTDEERTAIEQHYNIIYPGYVKTYIDEWALNPTFIIGKKDNTVIRWFANETDPYDFIGVEKLDNFFVTFTGDIDEKISENKDLARFDFAWKQPDDKEEAVNTLATLLKKINDTDVL